MVPPIVMDGAMVLTPGTETVSQVDALRAELANYLKFFDGGLEKLELFEEEIRRLAN